jgi:hypothetical protein
MRHHISFHCAATRAAVTVLRIPRNECKKVNPRGEAFIVFTKNLSWLVAHRGQYFSVNDKSAAFFASRFSWATATDLGALDSAASLEQFVFANGRAAQ